LKTLRDEAGDGNRKGPGRRTAVLMLYNRIMKLSNEDLVQEATMKEGEKTSVFHDAAVALQLPFDAVDRLCDAVGVDSKDVHGMNGMTAIMWAAAYRRPDVVEFLARNKRAGLSIMSNDCSTVYNLVEINPAWYISRKER
jgi:ankyrin repeat protein